MAKGRGKGKGRGALEQQIIWLKYLLFFFNVISWLLAAVVFSLALWIRFEEDFKHWVFELKMQHFWTGAYVLLAAACLVMIISFFGCCGAIMENPCMLTTYSVLLGICFVIGLAGSAYILDHGIENSKIKPWLRGRFLELIARYDTEPRARRIVDMIQEYIRCCGAAGYNDFEYREIPFSCRNHVTGNNYINGCAEEMSMYLESKTGWIAGIGLVLCLLQIFGILFAVCLCRAIKREAKDYQ